MLLQMDCSLAEKYINSSQKVRVVTEFWVEKNMFCPRCGCVHIAHYENNKPVADFYCPHCGNQFELKSNGGTTLKKVNDGAYSKMIERITSMNNPDFFFMTYSKRDWIVKNFFFVPKHFFTPEIIEKRAPLASTSRRAGWTGCNILLENIPSTGRIPIIKNGIIFGREIVMHKVNMADKLDTANLKVRGWLLDILSCIERLPGSTFTLTQMYGFENELSKKHPDNNNVKAKIRQQLQFLRDKGVIEFERPGEYRKLNW